MNEPPLDELYFKWLYSKTGSLKLKNPSQTYWSILRLLYRKAFIWIEPNDDNRMEDGSDLRYDFIDEEGIEKVDIEWMSLGCSILELLIGLSRRLSFEADGSPRDWFWQLMDNLGLDKYNDKITIPEDEVEEILDHLIWRTYEPDGIGGLFPLKWPKRDQRDVEIWYQMSSYIMEQEEM